MCTRFSCCVSFVDFGREPQSLKSNSLGSGIMQILSVFGYKCTCSSNLKTQFISILEGRGLTPKGRSPIFGPFLKLGQAIVDAIFVQKI
jgi:hypothetical protein